VVVANCDLATAAAALRASKPLICLPLTGEEIDVTTRVIDSGAGLDTRANVIRDVVWTAPEDTARELIGAVTAITSNKEKWMARARRVGVALEAAGGAKRAAHLVETVLMLGDGVLLPIKRPWYSEGEHDVNTAFACGALGLFFAAKAMSGVYAAF